MASHIMHDTVKRLYLSGRIDEVTGLKNAVFLKWITEEERDAIIVEKLQQENPSPPEEEVPEDSAPKGEGEEIEEA